MKIIKMENKNYLDEISDHISIKNIDYQVEENEECAFDEYNMQEDIDMIENLFLEQDEEKIQLPKLSNEYHQSDNPKMNLLEININKVEYEFLHKRSKSLTKNKKKLFKRLILKKDLKFEDSTYFINTKRFTERNKKEFMKPYEHDFKAPLFGNPNLTLNYHSVDKSKQKSNRILDKYGNLLGNTSSYDNTPLIKCFVNPNVITQHHRYYDFNVILSYSIPLKYPYYFNYYENIILEYDNYRIGSIVNNHKTFKVVNLKDNKTHIEFITDIYHHSGSDFYTIGTQNLLDISIKNFNFTLPPCNLLFNNTLGGNNNYNFQTRQSPILSSDNYLYSIYGTPQDGKIVEKYDIECKLVYVTFPKDMDNNNKESLEVIKSFEFELSNDFEKATFHDIALKNTLDHYTSMGYMRGDIHTFIDTNLEPDLLMIKKNKYVVIEVTTSTNYTNISRKSHVYSHLCHHLSNTLTNKNIIHMIDYKLVIYSKTNERIEDNHKKTVNEYLEHEVLVSDFLNIEKHLNYDPYCRLIQNTIFYEHPYQNIPKPMEERNCKPSTKFPIILPSKEIIREEIVNFVDKNFIQLSCLSRNLYFKDSKKGEKEDSFLGSDYQYYNDICFSFNSLRDELINFNPKISIIENLIQSFPEKNEFTSYIIEELTKSNKLNAIYYILLDLLYYSKILFLVNSFKHKDTIKKDKMKNYYKSYSKELGSKNYFCDDYAIINIKEGHDLLVVFSLDPKTNPFFVLTNYQSHYNNINFPKEYFISENLKLNCYGPFRYDSQICSNLANASLKVLKEINILNIENPNLDIKEFFLIFIKMITFSTSFNKYVHMIVGALKECLNSCESFAGNSFEPIHKKADRPFRNKYELYCYVESINILNKASRIKAINAAKVLVISDLLSSPNQEIRNQKVEIDFESKIDQELLSKFINGVEFEQEEKFKLTPVYQNFFTSELLYDYKYYRYVSSSLSSRFSTKSDQLIIKVFKPVIEKQSIMKYTPYMEINDFYISKKKISYLANKMNEKIKNISLSHINDITNSIRGDIGIRTKSVVSHTNNLYSGNTIYNDNIIEGNSKNMMILINELFDDSPLIFQIKEKIDEKIKNREFYIPLKIGTLMMKYITEIGKMLSPHFRFDKMMSNEPVKFKRIETKMKSIISNGGIPASISYDLTGFTPTQYIEIYTYIVSKLDNLGQHKNIILQFLNKLCSKEILIPQKYFENLYGREISKIMFLNLDIQEKDKLLVNFETNMTQLLDLDEKSLINHGKWSKNSIKYDELIEFHTLISKLYTKDKSKLLIETGMLQGVVNPIASIVHSYIIELFLSEELGINIESAITVDDGVIVWDLREHRFDFVFNSLVKCLSWFNHKLSMNKTFLGLSSEMNQILISCEGENPMIKKQLNFPISSVLDNPMSLYEQFRSSTINYINKGGSDIIGYYCHLLSYAFFNHVSNLSHIYKELGINPFKIPLEYGGISMDPFSFDVLMPNYHINRLAYFKEKSMLNDKETNMLNYCLRHDTEIQPTKLLFNRSSLSKRLKNMLNKITSIGLYKDFTEYDKNLRSINPKKMIAYVTNMIMKDGTEIYNNISNYNNLKRLLCYSHTLYVKEIDEFNNIGELLIETSKEEELLYSLKLLNNFKKYEVLKEKPGFIPFALMLRKISNTPIEKVSHILWQNRDTTIYNNLILKIEKSENIFNITSRYNFKFKSLLSNPVDSIIANLYFDLSNEKISRDDYIFKDEISLKKDCDYIVQDRYVNDLLNKFIETKEFKYLLSMKNYLNRKYSSLNLAVVNDCIDNFDIINFSRNIYDKVRLKINQEITINSNDNTFRSLLISLKDIGHDFINQYSIPIFSIFKELLDKSSFKQLKRIFNKEMNAETLFGGPSSISFKFITGGIPEEYWGKNYSHLIDCYYKSQFIGKFVYKESVKENEYKYYFISKTENKIIAYLSYVYCLKFIEQENSNFSPNSKGLFIENIKNEMNFPKLVCFVSNNKINNIDWVSANKKLRKHMPVFLNPEVKEGIFSTIKPTFNVKKGIIEINGYPIKYLINLHNARVDTAFWKEKIANLIEDKKLNYKDFISKLPLIYQLIEKTGGLISNQNTNFKFLHGNLYYIYKSKFYRYDEYINKELPKEEIMEDKEIDLSTTIGLSVLLTTFQANFLRCLHLNKKNRNITFPNDFNYEDYFYQPCKILTPILLKKNFGIDIKPFDNNKILTENLQSYINILRECDFSMTTDKNILFEISNYYLKYYPVPMITEKRSRRIIKKPKINITLDELEDDNFENKEKIKQDIETKKEEFLNKSKINISATFKEKYNKLSEKEITELFIKEENKRKFDDHRKNNFYFNNKNSRRVKENKTINFNNRIIRDKNKRLMEEVDKLFPDEIESDMSDVIIPIECKKELRLPNKIDQIFECLKDNYYGLNLLATYKINSILSSLNINFNIDEEYIEINELLRKSKFYYLEEAKQKDDNLYKRNIIFCTNKGINTVINLRAETYYSEKNICCLYEFDNNLKKLLPYLRKLKNIQEIEMYDILCWEEIKYVSPFVQDYEGSLRNYRLNKLIQSNFVVEKGNSDSDFSDYKSDEEDWF